MEELYEETHPEDHLVRREAGPATLRPAVGDAADLVGIWLAIHTSPHTRRAYKTDVGRFFAFTRKEPHEITLPDLLAYREHLAAAELQLRSQNRALTAIKSLLSFGQKTGYLQFNVGAALKLQTAKETLAERILEETDVSRLINAAREGRDQMIIRLLYISGIRRSELCGLKWIDAVGRGEQGGQITVFGKGNKTRAILLKPRTWQRLIALRNGADVMDPIFISRKKGHLAPATIWRIVRETAARAGLEQKVSPHWMRHSHGSHSLDHGAPIHLVRDTMGHASIATTGKYAHARPNESSSLFLPD